VTLQLSQPQEQFLTRVIFAFLLTALVSLTFSIAASSIAFGTAVVLGLTFHILTKKISPTPFDYYFLAYAAAETLSTIFSFDPLSSLVNMKRFFLIAVVYLTILSVNTRQKYIWTMLLVVAVTSLLSVFESMMLIGMADFSARLSMFQHYMTAGGIKMIVALLVLPFLLEKQIPLKWRMWALVSSMVLFVALILTQTRSSWLGFIAGVVTIAALKSKKLLLGFIALVLLFFLLAPPNFTQRATSIFDLTLPSNLARIHMITTGWQMFLDYPLFGTGDIDLKELYVTYREPIDSAEGGHLHNNFMMLLVTLGAVGFTIVTALFVKIFLVERGIVQRLHDDWLYGSATLGCFAGYIGFHVNGLFEWNFGDHEIAVLLWFTVGFVLASQKLYERELTEVVG
jgi:O-antigen ligase